MIWWPDKENVVKQKEKKVTNAKKKVLKNFYIWNSTSKLSFWRMRVKLELTSDFLPTFEKWSLNLWMLDSCVERISMQQQQQSLNPKLDWEKLNRHCGCISWITSIWNLMTTFVCPVILSELWLYFHFYLFVYCSGSNLLCY